MFKNTSIAVVVPAYNEEGFVGDVIDGVPEFVDRLYVVDDCSTDGTWAEIRRHVRIANMERRSDGRGDREESDGRVELADGGYTKWAYAIRHEENTGVGGAIKTGYRRALEDGIAVTAVMNGDGQMDPQILERIISPVVEGTAAYAKGNRLSSPGDRVGMTPWRFLGNATLTLLTKVASGYWKVQDPQNGYTAISAEALERIPLDDLYDRYGFVNDLLVKLNAHGLSVTDVPMTAVYRDEESSIRYHDFIPRVSLLLTRNFLWRLKAKYVLRDFHPLVFFYSLGTFGVGVGFLLGCWALLGSASTVLLGAIALLISMVGGGFVLTAMVFDMIHNARLEPSNRG